VAPGAGDPLERAAVEGQLAAQILARLLQLDEDVLLGHDAIGAGQVLDRGADEAARADPRQAEAAAVQFREAVGLGSARSARDALGIGQPLRDRGGGNVIIVRLLADAV